MTFKCNDSTSNELLKDACISINDGPPGAWWMSPDIFLNDTREGLQPDPGLGSLPIGVPPDTARQQDNNQVTVRVHKSCNPAGKDSETFGAVVELWVTNPSLVISGPADGQSVKAIDDQYISYDKFVGSPSSAHITKVWKAEHATPGNNEDPNRVHRCLIARCYPDNLTAPTVSFCVLEDDHVAQRNIAMVPASGKKITFFIQTTGRGSGMIESATIRTIADRYPSNALINSILPSIKQFGEFQKITHSASVQFALEVPEKFSPVIRDNSRPEITGSVSTWAMPLQDRWRYAIRDGFFNINRIFSAIFNPKLVLQEAILVTKFNTPLNIPRSQLKQSRSQQLKQNLTMAPDLKLSAKLEWMIEQAAPTYEAEIKIPQNDIANLTFTAELPEGSKPGDAHIFHIMHIDERQQVIGGFTVVAIDS